MKRSLNPNERAISEAINAGDGAVVLLRNKGHHAISKFKLWLTVRISVFIRKRMQHNVAIKSHRRSSSVLTPELRKKWVRLPYYQVL
jgi:hypothetical protein